MKLNAIVLAFPLLIAAGAATAAGPTATLKVVGTIKAPACTIAMSDLGEADFGEIGRGDLDPLATKPQGSRKIDVDLTCTSPTAVALRLTDQNPTHKPTGAMLMRFDNIGTNTVVNIGETGIFGLGVANGKSIGGFAIRVGKIQVGGVEQATVSSSPTGLVNTWTNRGATYDFLNTGAFFMPTAASGVAYVSGETFKFPLDVAVSTNLSGQIDGTADIPLAGAATVDVFYL